jgi:cytoskeletal protein CcmA (bactofilin family)
MLFAGKPRAPTIRTLVGEGTCVEGEIRFVEGLRIDGHVRGDLLAQGSEPSLVVVSDRASVHGSIHAGHVIISGEVHGPVHAHQLLELQAKARIVGDVRYGALEMHQGATISGDLKPLEVDQPASQSPVVSHAVDRGVSAVSGDVKAIPEMAETSRPPSQA